MSVRAKLALAIMPLVLAITAIGVLTIVTALRLGGSPEAILRQNYQSVLAAQAMREALERLDAAASLALAGRREALQGEASHRERFADALLLQEASVFERAEGAPTQRLRVEWAAYEKSYARFTATALGAVDGSAARLYADQLNPGFERIKRGLDEILSVNQRAMFDKSSWARTTAQSTIRGVVVAAILALVAALPVSVLLVQRVLSRLDRVSRAAERLGRGDFRARVGLGGRDEIAVLGRRFDEMATRLEEYSASSLGRLLEAQRTSQAAIDSIPDPILVFDTRGSLVSVNGAASALFGISAGAGRDPLQSLPYGVRTAVERARDHVLHGGGAYAPRGFEEAVRVSTASGDVFLLARSTPVERPGAGSVGSTVILHEVTRLRQLDALRSAMVATVAHELRTPLTSLRMAILLCLEEAVAAPRPNARAGLLATARDDCERLQATVDELLDLARIQSGEIELRRRSVAARDLVDVAVAHVGAMAREREVTLASAGVPGGIDVEVDSDQLQLVFSNLLGNAIRHSPVGGTVTLRAEPLPGAVRFEVSDGGSGIAPEHVGLVFDRFYRVPGAPPGGVGLGLAIARELVVAHGGEIGVESRVGHGSLFWFTVPRTAQPASQAS